MTQSQLNRAVARVTGEAVRTIRRQGFSFVPMPSDDLPLERDGDADDLGADLDQAALEGLRLDDLAIA